MKSKSNASMNGARGTVSPLVRMRTGGSPETRDSVSAMLLPLALAFAVALALALTPASLGAAPTQTNTAQAQPAQAQAQPPATPNATSTPAAQNQDASNPRSEQLRQRLQQIQDRLQLTPEQIEQVRPILTEEMQQLKDLRDKSANSGDQNRRAKLKMGRELRGIQKSTDKKLEKILSKQQMDELKQLREEWRQQLRERAAER